MKRSELREIIKEELRRTLKESSVRLGYKNRTHTIKMECIKAIKEALKNANQDVSKLSEKDVELIFWEHVRETLVNQNELRDEQMYNDVDENEEIHNILKRSGAYR